MAAVEYSVVSSKKRNFEAHEHCQRSSQLGELAWPENQAENDCLESLYPSTSIWLGISREENKWLSPHGPVTWFNFAPNAPSHNANCVKMFNAVHLGKWDDLACNQALHFVCQRGKALFQF